MDINVIHGCSLSVLQELINKNVTVDSIVTDPPYELGFMGKAWDKSGIAYNQKLWELCLQILKPGGHLLSFGGSRTYHRMATTIENAGFEIRDQIMWVYGSGFPKSLDVSKAIDKAAGAEREVIRTCVAHDIRSGNFINQQSKRHLINITAPSTNLAKQWQGWGTALKPAHEPIVMARKPLSESTIAANVLTHNTGGINIDGCRVDTVVKSYKDNRLEKTNEVYGKYKPCDYDGSKGRFPANLIHDGSDEVREHFGENRYKFFYHAKANKTDRNDSKHPTVKPVNLMRYLCRLVTPPGGTVLDPFAGSGTTGYAANEEGFNAILIEKEQEYVNDIKKRFSP